MKYYLKLLSMPLSVLAIYLSLDLIWRIFNLPNPENLTLILKEWFSQYGLFTLFFSAILEGLLVVGNYFPGVLVIVLSVLVAGSAKGAMMAVAVGTIGLMIAHVINYFLGKYGWYKILVHLGMKEHIEESKAKLEKRGLWAIPLSYWLPSLGALTNTAVGIMNIPFKNFILFSIPSSIFWYSLVGFVVYNVGDKAIKFAGAGTANVYGFGIIAIWMLLLLIWDRK